MLVFIDESGHPRPGDPTSRPVILAVCIREADCGRLARTMFALRRNLQNHLKLSRTEQEGHAVELLNRRALTRMPPKREFADSIFDALRDFNLAVFAVVMERPDQEPYAGSDFLQPQFKWLLERISLFMEHEHPDEFAICVFDGQTPTQNRRFSDSFTNFMARTAIGQAMDRIVPTPFFVDSALTPGIQVADLFAYVTRLNEEKELHRSTFGRDLYLSVIRRYAQIVRAKTRDYEDDTGFVHYGIATMSADKFLRGVPDEWVRAATKSPDDPELN